MKNTFSLFHSLFISDVIRSMIGAIIWTVIAITWITLFQLNRADWGRTADDISFIIPKGIP